VAAGHALAEWLNVRLDKQTIKLTENQPRLKTARALRCAAQGYAAEGDKDNAERVLGTIGKMLKTLKAPESASEALDRFKHQLESSKWPQSD
jgi:hypothetical protein